MKDHFLSGVCPDRRTLNDCYLNMMAVIDAETDDELRRKMSAELRAFRVMNLRFALLRFESDERQSR